MQPKTDLEDLSKAIKEFEENLPGWWWSVGVCSVSRDASCGPDIAGPDSNLLMHKIFDDGFHCDDRDGSLESSLRDVMDQALTAKKKYRASCLLFEELKEPVRPFSDTFSGETVDDSLVYRVRRAGPFF